jgi:hypothetical protein
VTTNWGVEKPKPKQKTVNDQTAADSIEIDECIALLEHVTKVLETERGTNDSLAFWRRHPDSDQWIDIYTDNVYARFMARFSNDEETVALYTSQLGCLPCACLDELFGAKPSSVPLVNIVEFARQIVHNYYQTHVCETRVREANKRKVTQRQNKTASENTDAKFEVVFGTPASITFSQVSVPFVTTAVAVQYNIYNELGVFVKTSDFARLHGVTSAGRAAGFCEHDLVPVDVKNMLLNGYYGHSTHAIEVYHTSLTPHSDSLALHRTDTTFEDTDYAHADAQVALKRTIDFEHRCRGKFYFTVQNIAADSEKWRKFQSQIVECTIAWSDGQQSIIHGVRILTDLGASGNGVQNGDIITNDTGNLFALCTNDLDPTLRVFRPHFQLSDTDGDDHSQMWISAFLTETGGPHSNAKKLLNVTEDFKMTTDYGRDVQTGDILVRIGSEVINAQALADAKRMVGLFPTDLALYITTKRYLPAVEDRLQEAGIAMTIPSLNPYDFHTDSTGIVRSVSSVATESGLRIGDRVSCVFYTDKDEYLFSINTTNNACVDRRVVLVHGPLSQLAPSTTAAAAAAAPTTTSTTAASPITDGTPDDADANKPMTASIITDGTPHDTVVETRGWWPF